MTRGIKGDSSIGDNRDRSFSDQRDARDRRIGDQRDTGASVTRGDRSIGDQRDQGDTEEPAGSRAS